MKRRISADSLRALVARYIELAPSEATEALADASSEDLARLIEEFPLPAAQAIADRLDPDRLSAALALCDERRTEQLRTTTPSPSSESKPASQPQS